MWLNEDQRIYKQDLPLSKPFVNAAGSLGFAPDSHTMPFLSNLGAFITHPISRRGRKPASNRACLPFRGGFLLHTGLPNPGISRVISKHQPRWENAPLPIIVHLIVETPQGLAEMIRKLEGLENIGGVELGIPPDCNPGMLASLLDAAVGELPGIVSLSADQVPILLDWIGSNPHLIIHLTEPRGSLPGTAGDIITGRLYGPAIFPQMLHTARLLVETGVQVISNGGIFTRWQAQAMLDQGVSAVGLSSSLWQLNSSDLFDL